MFLLLARSNFLQVKKSQEFRKKAKVGTKILIKVDSYNEIRLIALLHDLFLALGSFLLLI